MTGLYIPNSDTPSAGVARSRWRAQVLRTPGLQYHVSAENAGAVSTLPRRSRELHSNAPLAVDNGMPTLSTAGLNGKQGFSFTTGPVLLTDLGIRHGAGTPDVFTLFTVFQGATASFNGSVFAYWAGTNDGGSNRFFVGSLLTSPPKLAVGTNNVTQALWTFGSALVAGTVQAAAVCVNGPLGHIRIYVDGNLGFEQTGLSIAAHASAKWYFWGLPGSGVCFRGIGGDSVVVHGYDLSTLAGGQFLEKLFEEAAAYYA